MKIPSTYLALVAVFIIGVGTAIGFQVHAQSVAAAPASTQAAVQTSQQDPTNADGETADDSAIVQSTQQDLSNTDGETADDASVSPVSSKTTVAADATESESGTGADANEVEDAN
ncbi:hypothetical protein H0X32_00605 [Patescibacteria group bacterium]|nr:hypothetical protein [Patescibacteria group bacterium]